MADLAVVVLCFLLVRVFVPTLLRGIGLVLRATGLRSGTPKGAGIAFGNMFGIPVLVSSVNAAVRGTISTSIALGVVPAALWMWMLVEKFLKEVGWVLWPSGFDRDPPFDYPDYGEAHPVTVTILGIGVAGVGIVVCSFGFVVGRVVAAVV